MAVAMQRARWRQAASGHSPWGILLLKQTQRRSRQQRILATVHTISPTAHNLEEEIHRGTTVDTIQNHKSQCPQRSRFFFKSSSIKSTAKILTVLKSSVYPEILGYSNQSNSFINRSKSKIQRPSQRDQNLQSRLGLVWRQRSEHFSGQAGFRLGCFCIDATNNLASRAHRQVKSLWAR